MGAGGEEQGSSNQQMQRTEMISNGTRHTGRGRDDTNGSWGVAWRPLTVAFSTSISRNLRSLTESFLRGLLDSVLSYMWCTADFHRPAVLCQNCELLEMHQCVCRHFWYLHFLSYYIKQLPYQSIIFSQYRHKCTLLIKFLSKWDAGTKSRKLWML